MSCAIATLTRAANNNAILINTFIPASSCLFSSLYRRLAQTVVYRGTFQLPIKNSPTPDLNRADPEKLLKLPENRGIFR